jgi:hypothetical protein
MKKSFAVFGALLGACPAAAQTANFPGIVSQSPNGAPSAVANFPGIVQAPVISPTGATILRHFGNSGGLQGTSDPTDLLIGIGAGANLPAVDDLATFVGWHAGNQMTNTNSESTGVGFNTQGAVTH